jgi:CRP-like cAMP-binding protein
MTTFTQNTTINGNKFLMKVIRNIDYFNTKIPDIMIEDLIYKLDVQTIAEGSHLFKYGKPCTEIYIIVNGEIDIYFYNQDRETYIDTLFSG